MEKTKVNITLAAGSEVRQSGLWLALQKGLCELRRPGKGSRRKEPMPKGNWEKKLSVIICTTGTCPGLWDALSSALSQTVGREDYEVILVWNKEELPQREVPKGVRLVQEVKPGLSYARNTGAKAAKGNILLYMDDDAVADKNLVLRILEAFRKDPGAAVVGGQILLALPSPRPEVFLPGKEGLWSGYRVPYRRYRNVKEQYAFPYGACFAVRHDALLHLGGFPTDYGRVGEDYAGGEETALCFMVLKQGWKIGIQPGAWVEHRVEPRRFNREHIKETLRASILTTYRLCKDGYAPKGWNARYIKDRLRIAEEELKRLQDSGGELEQYYKACERDAFLELVSTLDVKEG